MTAKIVYFTFVVVDFEQTFKKSKHGITQCPINLPDVDLKVFSFNDAQQSIAERALLGALALPALSK